MMRKFRFLPLFLLAVAALAIPSTARAQVAVGVSIRIGPPPLPVYAQPICPAPGYLWTPGYWAYGPDGYYWVPGTWILAPRPGFLWTPGYWGFAGGFYVWHGGYWGPHVGFYGGIHYGFGYNGVGFYGGAWRNGVFFYNRSVTHVNINIIHNTYNRTVIVRNVNRVSFNGRGGIEARPNRQQMAYEHEQRFQATREQMDHREAASRDRSQWASQNHGRPGFAATPRAGDFNHRDMTQSNRQTRMNQNRENRQNRQMNRQQQRNQNNHREKPHGNDHRPHGRGRF